MQYLEQDLAELKYLQSQLSKETDPTEIKILKIRIKNMQEYFTTKTCTQ